MLSTTMLRAGGTGVRMCLFPRVGRLTSDGLACTWELFGPDTDDRLRHAILDWHVAHAMNAITFLLHTVPTDGHNVISFFKGDPIANYGKAGALDGERAALLLRWMDAFNNAGVLCVPTLLCDDNATIYPLGYDRHAEFIALALQSLNDRVGGWIVGCESNKWRPDAANRTMTFHALMKRFTAHPVGCHWAGLDFPLTDFCAYEHSYPVTRWRDQRTADVVAEGAAAIERSAGRPLVFAEYHVDPADAKAREFTRALARLPGAAGIGGIE